MFDRLLPPNATPADLALEQSTARLADLPANLVRWMQSPQLIPVDALPWLAWAFSVDTWDENWSDDQKRATIAASYMIHRHKGTIGAVKASLAALGFQSTIIEWFQESPPGDPYTFRIKIDADQVGAEQGALARIAAVLEASKNLRSHLTTINLDVTSKSSVVCALVTGMGHEITISAG